MSTSASMAARLVPGATGSARLSPWTTMSGAPRARAWAVRGPMRAGGRWVNSRPGMSTG